MSLFHKLIQNPAEIFSLAAAPESTAEFNRVTKALLDPIAQDHSVLDEIYTDGLDSSQVWGQVQMVLLNIGETYLLTEIPALRALGAAHGDSDDENASDRTAVLDQEDEEGAEEEFFLLEEGAESGESEESEESDAEGSAEDALDAESEVTKVESAEQLEQPAQPVKDAFGLNDGFFDIDKFNAHVLALEDDEQADEDEEEVDLFADMSDEENAESEDMEYYDGFFDQPGASTETSAPASQKPEPQNEEDDDEELSRELREGELEKAVDGAMHDFFDEFEEEAAPAPKNLSSFEKQQQKIQAEIAGLEAELIAEKKWTMKGEVKSKDRPADSLLNDDDAPNLEFDRTSKPVPVITDEVTETIEDLIKRRVRNDEFNDLPRRLVSDVGKFVQKKKTEVSDQKSAKSLAEIYEDQYHGTEPEDKLSDEVQAAHDEITDLFRTLNYKLDSLCLAHYIPKPNEYKSIEILVSDAPASIAMEDAQPLHVSDEVKLAPQEIYRIGDDKPKADGARGTSQVQLKSGLSYLKDELDRDDKQRLRRAKKRAKSKHFSELNELKAQREKLNPAPKEDDEGNRKRQRVGEVVDTLSKAKNLTVIDGKGQLRDGQGKLKKSAAAPTSNSFRL